MLDDIDNKIIAILKENARTPLSEIATRINRSRTAVQARVTKLETTGLILGYTIRQMNRDENTQTRAMVTIYLHERLESDELMSILHSYPEVRSCHRVSGDADLLVEIGDAPHGRIQELCRMLWNHDNVRLTTTVFILDTLIQN